MLLLRLYWSIWVNLTLELSFCGFLLEHSSNTTATNTYFSHRSKEYDTYRDPRGPISAGVQTFFGAIANFVTGITSAPTDIVNNVISASHAINHPHVHSDPRSQCGCPGHVTLRTDGERAGDQEDARGLPGEGAITDGSIYENGRARDTLPESSGEQDTNPLPTPQQSMSSVNSAIGFRGFMSEAGLHGMRGLKKFFNVVVWIPTDLTLSMTKGFHNAPKLYNDVTVQPSPKVTGFRSGLRAARMVCLLFVIFCFSPSLCTLYFFILTLIIGIKGRFLPWYHRARHPSQTWSQIRRREGAGHGSWERRRWGYIEAYCG